MSPNNVTPVREADDSPPEISASPPGFPSVRVYYQGSRDEGKGLWFEYCGTLEDLVAGGAATPEMLRMNPGTGARYKRIDEDGFASAGFTGQKVKAGSKLHDHVVNDGVIF